MKEEGRNVLSRLVALVAIRDAQVIANPLPYLDQMAAKVTELQELLEAVEYALSPDCVFDFWDKNVDKNAIPRPIDFQGEALLRCDKALSLLQEYRYKTK